MKKSISLLVVLALILAIFAVVGCGGEEVADDEALTATVVVSSGFGDNSFNDSAWAGGEQLAADYGINVKYTECGNEGYKQKLMDAAEDSEFVVAVGWECYEIGEVAPEYPDTKFIFVDNPAANIENIPNLLCITYAQNEGSFLAGYIAANMSETGVIGAVGGDESAAVNDFLTGYEQGAKHANPDIRVEKVTAGSYEDPAAGSECARALYGRGADVVLNVAGNAGAGIFAAAQELGFYAIGTDADQKLTNPEYDDVIICSVKKEVGRSIYDMIAAFIDNGTWSGGQVMVSDMATGYLSIAYGDESSTQQVDDTLKAEADALAGQIVAGEITVKTAR